MIFLMRRPMMSFLSPSESSLPCSSTLLSRLKKWNKQERYRMKPGKHLAADSCSPMIFKVSIAAFSDTHSQIETLSEEIPEL